MAEGVNLEEGHAGRVALPANDGRVTTGRQGADDGGFPIIRRRDGRAGDRGFLGGAPVVVRGEERRIGVVKLKRRIE